MYPVSTDRPPNRRLQRTRATRLPLSRKPLDRHSRRVLGWSLDSKRDLTQTLDALNRARRRRWQPGLIFHSDQGVEYSAYAFRARLAALGITQSMKRPREIGDNAFIESFFHSMKAEAIHARVFPHDRALREASPRVRRRVM